MQIAFKQTPNYTKGTGVPKLGFVLHGTLGGYVGAVEWLMTPPEKRKDKSQSSANFVIGRNRGEVTQLVKIGDISWHAGVLSNPAPRVQKSLPKNANGSYKNPNIVLVGIEFAWGYDLNGDGVINAYDKTLTEWQYECALDIIKNSGIAFNPDMLFSHKELTDYKTDDMKFAVDEVTKRMTPAPIDPKIAALARLEAILTEASQIVATLKK